MSELEGAEAEDPGDWLEVKAEAEETEAKAEMYPAEPWHGGSVVRQRLWDMYLRET